MECPFCDFENEIKHRILLETDNFYLIPGLGDFLGGGYLAIVSKEHFICMGSLKKEKIEELKKVEAKAIKFLKEKYNKSITIFEHGECIYGDRQAAACIEHFHVLLMPTNLSIKKDIKDELGSGKKINDYTNLIELYKNSIAYLLLKENQEINYWPNPKILSQYIRRIIAKKLNRKDFDWKRFPYLENINKTKADWFEWLEKNK